MKKMLVLCVLFMVVSVSPVFALTFSVYEQGDTHSIDMWINGGQVTVLEDFEGVGVDGTMAWYKSLETGVGVFTTVESNIGTGATSYNANNSDSDEAYFSIQDRNSSWYGRYNTTDDIGASQWLDSGDIDKLTLNVDPKSLTNLFFYMQDPSDVKAITTVGTDVNTKDYAEFSGERNGASYFVGITLKEGETLSKLIWSTDTVGDGYGLDDFSTVAAAPVPEPATMLIVGTGLVGLASTRMRRKKK